MKKVIPEKIANKVYNILLPYKNEKERVWTYKSLYKPGTSILSFKFFKNKAKQYIRVAKKDEWDIENKLISTIKRWQSTEEQLNDYIQERSEHI